MREEGEGEEEREGIRRVDGWGLVRGGVRGVRRGGKEEGKGFDRQDRE